MKVRINVTKRDIELGTRNESESCPLARAIGRRVTASLSVGSASVQIGRGTNFCDWHNILLPEDAAQFIDRFDFGLNVKPFTFTFDIPEEFLRMKPTSTPHLSDALREARLAGFVVVVRTFDAGQSVSVGRPGTPTLSLGVEWGEDPSEAARRIARHVAEYTPNEDDPTIQHEGAYA